MIAVPFETDKSKQHFVGTLAIIAYPTLYTLFVRRMGRKRLGKIIVSQSIVVSRLDMYRTNVLMYRTMVLMVRPTKGQTLDV